MNKNSWDVPSVSMKPKNAAAAAAVEATAVVAVVAVVEAIAVAVAAVEKETVAGVAIHVGETVQFAEPPSLDKIRKSIPGFHPPQCYSYLAAGSAAHEAMLELVPSGSQSAIG